MKIAILGGSFDPPHRGHVAIAKRLLKLFHFDQIWLMPLFQHPFSKNLSNPAIRFAMAKYLENENIKVSDLEISKKTISYTIDTLIFLTEKYPQDTFCWIIGTDQVNNFTRWKKWREIINKFKIIIVPRTGFKKTAKEIKNISKQIDNPKNIILVNKKNFPPVYISSTLTRKKIKEKKSISNLVPKKIEKYIIRLKINPPAETKKITSFIKTVLREQRFKNIVIGLSGGIDSAVSLSLLKEVVSPDNIFVTHLYYFKSQINILKSLLRKTNIPQKNIYNISIKKSVDELKKTMKLTKHSKDYRIRFGNIMARIRMIALYDLAKKHNALVCGTENKSEFYLGYFTRFGDEASDFEPIRHLYKTQIYQLAKYLSIPRNIIDQEPTAGLWTGQTDEKEFGFSYKEADIVLYLYFERKNSLSTIISKGFSNAKRIIDWACKNSFKHHLPYTIK